MSLRNAVLLGPLGLALILNTASLRAGTVVNLPDANEVTGKLTLNSATIHVEASSASEVNLSDVLEANFSDDPFHLDYFSSTSNPSQPLPAGWSGTDIGSVNAPGSGVYAAGEFTLTGDQWEQHDDNKDNTDHYFVFGRSWTGDGQWTARLKTIAAPNSWVRGGLMMRDSLDPLSANTGFADWDTNNIFTFARNKDHGTWANIQSIDNYPVWFRLTRQGYSLDYEISSDGKKWSMIGETTMELTATLWAGFYIDSHKGQAVQKVVLDQVLFTPAPGLSPSRTVLTGVLLRSGSFLAGAFNPLDFNNPTPVGNFTRNGKNVSISAAQTSAVVYHPVTRARLSEVENQVGVLMRNDDFLAGDFEAINGGGVRLNSIVLGTESYNLDQVRACLLNPLQLQPSDYEIRLKDGSVIRANGLSANNGQFAIGEVSGVSIPVAPDEIVQFRAGANHVQNLLELPWKTTPPPPAAPTPAAAPAVVPSATNAAPVANPPAALAAPAATVPTPSVQCWTGNNQEQIMAVPAGALIDFPLTGNFRGLALRVAVSPDSPPNAQVVVRILADGRQVGLTPAFKAGDAPRFMALPLSAPKTITLEPDANIPGASILFIDPVAIRENTP